MLSVSLIFGRYHYCYDCLAMIQNTHVVKVLSVNHYFSVGFAAPLTSSAVVVNVKCPSLYPAGIAAAMTRSTPPRSSITIFGRVSCRGSRSSPRVRPIPSVEHHS